MFLLNKLYSVDPKVFKIVVIIWAFWLVLTIVFMVMDYNKMYSELYNQKVAEIENMDLLKEDFDCSSGVCHPILRNPNI